MSIYNEVIYQGMSSIFSDNASVIKKKEKKRFVNKISGVKPPIPTLVKLLLNKIT